MSVDGEIEELEQIEKDLAKARRVAVDPRILEIASQVGEVDLRAGGRTVIDPTVLDATGGNMFPREWAGVGDVGLSYKQLGDKERRVKDAFFSSLLDLFDSYDGKNGYPTATEVMARQNQYLMQFSRLLCFLRMIFSRCWTGFSWCFTVPEHFLRCRIAS